MWGDFAVASPNCIEAGVASGSLCQSLRRNPKTTCTKRPPLEDGSTNNFHWVDNGSWWVAISWLTSPPSFSKRIHATVCQQQYCCTRILLTHLSKEGYKHHKHTTTPQQKTQKKKQTSKNNAWIFKRRFFIIPEKSARIACYAGSGVAVVVLSAGWICIAPFWTPEAPVTWPLGP